MLPTLRSELEFPQTLTDIAQGEEKTRNYAADRAYRNLHGLIDLLAEWHQLTNPGPYSLACEDYDAANALVRRFFTELVRRRGSLLSLRLLAVVAPRRGDQLASQFDPSTITAKIRLALPRGDTPASSREEMSRLALELEAQLPEDPAARDGQLPRLIDAWRRSTAPERALRWQLHAMARYNHFGLYEAALPYASAVEAGLDSLCAEDPKQYLKGVNVLYFCYVPLGRAAEARPILEHGPHTPAERR